MRWVLLWSFYEVQAVTAVSVTIATYLPGAQLVSPALVSLSIEQDLWTDWSGTNTSNSFFYNTLTNLKQRAGEPPWIRIGADSADRTNYNHKVPYSEAVFNKPSPKVPFPEATNVVVGDGFYEAVSNLPSGTHIIWGINLKELNLTATYLQAKAISRAFNSSAVIRKNITLDLVEVGNEPDLYPNRNVWGPDYVPIWTFFASLVSAAVGIREGSSTKLLVGSFALYTPQWSAQGIIKEGILNSEPGSQISGVSMHHYSGSFCGGNAGLLQDLMSKATIRSNISAYNTDIAAANARGLQYVFGETNSYACHGAPGVSDVAGAALWMLDYAMYGGTRNITRMYFHGGVGYKYSMIQPVALSRSPLNSSVLNTTLPPHIQPMYYGALIAAEAIGPSGNTTVTELSVDDNWISAYAFYDHGILARAVFINSHAYFQGSNRTSTQVELLLNGSQYVPTNMVVKRLAIQYADDTSGLQWGGQTFETIDAIPAGIPTNTTAAIGDGLSITQTEAILLIFS